MGEASLAAGSAASSASHGGSAGGGSAGGGSGRGGSAGGRSGPAGSEVAARLGPKFAAEIEQLDRELAEIDLLLAQARAEASRQETRRSALAEKMSAGAGSVTGGQAAAEFAELATQVILLTRRATVMDGQVEVLDGKRKTLARFRDATALYAQIVGPFGSKQATGGGDAGDDTEGGEAGEGESGGAGGAGAGAAGREIAATSRLLLSAQEDLRREIARAMHDGPAQSLTNIVLQAQIVERIVGGDPDVARGEVRQLIEMVEHTLEATKSFIFDVRPMVLDDLGLVPTLRRAARDRGRRAGVAVEFESLGADRRLPMELESGLFRILDEALAGYLAARPERVELRLDWSDAITAEIAGFLTPAAEEPEKSKGILGGLRLGGGEKKREMPAALAAMVEEQKASEVVAAEAARVAALVTLPPATWREIQSRAASLDIAVELHDEGSRLSVSAPYPSSDGAGFGPMATAAAAPPPSKSAAASSR